MGVDDGIVTADVTPADNFAIGNRDEMRIVFLDTVQCECARHGAGGGLREARQVLSLAGDDIERAMEKASSISAGVVGVMAGLAAVTHLLCPRSTQSQGPALAVRGKRSPCRLKKPSTPRPACA